jgi:hypothetical protein
VLLAIQASRAAVAYPKISSLPLVSHLTDSAAAIPAKLRI